MVDTYATVFDALWAKAEFAKNYQIEKTTTQVMFSKVITRMKRIVNLR
jgi:hypothetical protein